MKIEIIIHYNKDNKESDLYKTFKSIKDNDMIPDRIRLCVNPPISKAPVYNEFAEAVDEYFDTKIRSYLQVLTQTSGNVEEVINKTAEISDSDHYIFVNAGYAFDSDEIFREIKNNKVLFSDGVDDRYNEFSCKVKIHKNLGGFSEKHTLIEKIEYQLKMMEEAKNAAAAKLVNSDQNNQQ